MSEEQIVSPEPVLEGSLLAYFFPPCVVLRIRVGQVEQTKTLFNKEDGLNYTAKVYPWKYLQMRHRIVIGRLYPATQPAHLHPSAQPGLCLEEIAIQDYLNDEEYGNKLHEAAQLVEAMRAALEFLKQLSQVQMEADLVAAVKKAGRE